MKDKLLRQDNHRAQSLSPVRPVSFIVPVERYLLGCPVVRIRWTESRLKSHLASVNVLEHAELLGFSLNRSSYVRNTSWSARLC